MKVHLQKVAPTVMGKHPTGRRRGNRSSNRNEWTIAVDQKRGGRVSEMPSSQDWRPWSTLDIEGEENEGVRDSHALVPLLRWEGREAGAAGVRISYRF